MNKHDENVAAELTEKELENVTGGRLILVREDGKIGIKSLKIARRSRPAVG